MAKYNHPSYDGAIDFDKPINLVNVKHNDNNDNNDGVIDINELAEHLHRTVINLDFAYSRYRAAVREHDTAYGAWSVARNNHNPSGATDH